MELLEQKILSEGKVLPGGILKIDSFLNHQIDPQLIFEMAQEIKRLYEGERITKVLTIEASGIAIAVMAGYALGCPMVFAKKNKSKNISDSVYAAEVASFTHGNKNTVVLSKEYLGAEDRVHRGRLPCHRRRAHRASGAVQSCRCGGRRRGHRRREGVSGRREYASRGGYAHRVPCQNRSHERRQFGV